MRIISGKFKGTKLFIPISKKTRPLKDLVKESIFNTLLHYNKFPIKLENANVLDLYSGSGSFGLECLSRYANKVIFVENNKDALKILKKNIYKLNIENKTFIINKSVQKYLSNKSSFNESVNIIFCDPPYKELSIFDLVNNIFKANILEKNGIIIIHRSKKTEDNYPKNFKVLSIKKYGISKIIFGNLIS